MTCGSSHFFGAADVAGVAAKSFEGTRTSLGGADGFGEGLVAFLVKLLEVVVEARAEMGLGILVSTSAALAEPRVRRLGIGGLLDEDIGSSKSVGWFSKEKRIKKIPGLAFALGLFNYYCYFEFCPFFFFFFLVFFFVYFSFFFNLLLFFLMLFFSFSNAFINQTCKGVLTHGTSLAASR